MINNHNIINGKRAYKVKIEILISEARISHTQTNVLKRLHLQSDQILKNHHKSTKDNFLASDRLWVMDMLPTSSLNFVYISKEFRVMNPTQLGAVFDVWKAKCKKLLNAPYIEIIVTTIKLRGA